MYKSAEFMAQFACVGQNLQIFEHALILKPEKIMLESEVRIDDFARIEGGQGVYIGCQTHFSSFASILGGGGCSIGAYVGIAQGVRIVTGTGHPMVERFPVTPPPEDITHLRRSNVVIGDHAFIGVNAVILPGVTIGEGAEVAAGTIVARDVAAWTIVAGNPARAIGRRENFLIKEPV